LIPLDKGDKNLKDFILRSYWSSVRFTENETGQVTGMQFDNHKGVKLK